MSTTVELNLDTYARLQAIANEQNRQMSDIIADLLYRYEREKYWQEVNASVERLRADPVAWRDYQEEIRFFQGGSMDGLEDEEPYFTAEEEAEIRAEHARKYGS